MKKASLKALYWRWFLNASKEDRILLAIIN